MQMAAGSMIAVGLVGLVAGAALSVSTPALRPHETSMSPSVRVWLPDGEAYVDEIWYDAHGAPAVFVVQIGAGSRLAGRFVPTVPVMIRADQVYHDREQRTLHIPYSGKDLLAQQSAAGVPLGRADRPRLAGAPVITDDGHRFGEVESVREEVAGDLTLRVRLSGADGGLQGVPASCAEFVPDTGIVVVRTCDLGSA